MQPPTKPRLVSFKTCPFVQRAVLMLHEKGVDHETVYIDLAQKPDWFLKVSPRGKVPILLVDNAVLFESHPICEYLEEAFPAPPLLPTKLTERARDRAFFAFASEDLFVGMRDLTRQPSEATFTATRTALAAKIDRLADELGTRAYLSGDGTRFGFADVAVAPFFTRADLFFRTTRVDLLAAHPNLKAWSDRLLARAAVAASVPPDFADLWIEAMHKAKAYALQAG